MAIDIRQLSPTELIRLVNSTPLGPVLNAPKLNRQMNEAGFRITPGNNPKRISLVKYIAWLAKRREQPRKATISYAERKQREAERNLAKSRAGRDIGSPPEVPPEGVERRERCAHSFRGFCETYFPSAFCLRWSEDHLRVMAKIERAVLHGGLFAFAMPRGSGKTTLARVAGMWAVLYGHREYVCLIGSAEDQAKNILEAIKRDLLSNDLLLADFPEAVYPIRKLENNARRQIGQLCNGEPTYITWSADRLVMPTMKVPADLLMKSLQLNETTTANKAKPAVNPHVGKFEVVSSVYLASASFDGASSKAWYLLADPNRLPAIEIAFLNGVDRPTVEKTDADFNTLGVQFRGYIDFGVREQDPCATRLENVPFTWWRGNLHAA